jgi:5,10-methylene-tetrahydrofolate dehydrogenase/methenyl tetrahydrofolate cyclohydrolase
MPSVRKDVDGFHPLNIGGRKGREPLFVPARRMVSCTSLGRPVCLSNANAVVRSLQHRQQLRLCCLSARCAVTIYHSRSKTYPALPSGGYLVAVVVLKWYNGD